MKQINQKFDLSRPRNGEHYQFHTDILDILSSAFVTTHGIVTLRDTYKELFEIENECYLRNRNYMETPEVKAADKKRDELFLYIAQTIETNIHCPVKSKEEAATRLYFYLTPYRNAPRKSYAEKTAEVKDFAEKMQEGDIEEDIETLGLTNDIVELDNANKAFNTIYNKRSKESLARTISDNMKSIRPKVDAAYKELASAVNSLYQVNTLVTKNSTYGASLGTAIDEVNAVILRLQETLSRAGFGPKPNFTFVEKLEPTVNTPDDRPGIL